jgi:hypothetical protein
MEMTPEEHGLEVLDLRSDPAFADREIHNRDIGVQMLGLQRLSQALLERPDTILQELVKAAVDLCGADSAGISIEKPDGNDQEFYHWIATAGTYANFMDAILPRQSCTLRFFNDLQTRGERLRPPKSCKTAHFVDWIVDQESHRQIMENNMPTRRNPWWMLKH